MLGAIISALKEFGPFAGLVAFIAVMYWMMIKWFKELVKHVMDQAQKREEEQQAIIKSQVKEIRLQRRQRHKDHGKLSQGLDEIVKALGRINGYKQ